MLEYIWPLVTVPLSILDQARQTALQPVSAAKSLYATSKEYIFGTNVYVQRQLRGAFRKKKSTISIKEIGIVGCEERMKNAENYQVFTAYAQELDKLKKV
jgi:hypothetical protein